MHLNISVMSEKKGKLIGLSPQITMTFSTLLASSELAKEQLYIPKKCWLLAAVVRLLKNFFPKIFKERLQQVTCYQKKP